MKVLIACEYSGIVRDEFIKNGHDAISCDILPTDKNGPHYKGDVFDIINDGFDMMIAFPPCTHLAVSGAAWFKEKIKDGRQKQGIDFFMKLVKADIEKICIENPVGIMSNIYKKPNQIIHPYYFGDEARKKTCLWLKNLPPLFHASKPDLFNDKVTHVNEGEDYTFICKKTGKIKRQPLWYAIPKGKGTRGKKRSKTFPGIARAMAEQWNF